MRKHAFSIGLLSLVIGLAGCTQSLWESAQGPQEVPGRGTPQPQAGNGDLIPGRYIVVLNNGVSPGEVAQQYNVIPEFVYHHVFNGFAGPASAAQAQRLQGDSRVQSVQADRRITISQVEPEKGPPGGGGQPPQGTPTGILRIQGNLSSTVSGNGSGAVDVDVAVIDTGIQPDHPDLNVVAGTNCSTGSSSNFADGHGHGTHVAGTIAAKDNDIGVVGVAPGARLYAARVLNNAGSGSWSSVICGIDWVASLASTIEVANMSLGGAGSDGSCVADALHLAICNLVGAGVTVAVAAGNDSADAQGQVPAAYDEVITVSALADFDGQSGGNGQPTCRSDEDDTLANFSNFGADVDLMAPGVCILSTWKGSGYNTISGTSMASPHVAGAAALYLAGHPGSTPAQVKAALQGAGNLGWDNGDDPDGIKEVLLNVSGF